MANRPHIPAKEIKGNANAMDVFTRRILSVPHSAIKAQLDAEKEAKRTLKGGASHRVSRPKP